LQAFLLYLQTALFLINTGITPEPLDRFGRIRPQLAKVALGAEKTVAWDASARSARTTLKLFENLKNQGYKIYAVEQDKKAIPYYKLKPFDASQGENKRKLAFIFGNEVRGLPKSILRKADKILDIPMHGKKESLNVAVAVGIILFNFKRS